MEVNTFLTNVYAWFKDFFSLDIVIDKKTFLFGCAESEMINLVICHLKYYIYCSRCKENPLYLNKFKAVWINLYKIEKQRAVKNKCTRLFDEKWKVFTKLNE